jgi:hypothetical protein
MRNNRTLFRVVLDLQTFLIMALLIWGFWTARLFDHKEIQEQMMDGMMNKMK